MDIATVIGLGAGLLLILGSILATSDIGPFLDYPSFLMVTGGTICAALVSFPMQNLAEVFRILRNCFFVRARDPRAVIGELVRLAETARRHGLLALQDVSPGTTDPFVAHGLHLIVDGMDPATVESVLLGELEAVEARHREGRALFENIGRFAPAFGLIGTLVGLVIMLKKLNDPSAIGPAVAMALLTTLYGALLSNLVALPLAEKLGRQSRREIMLKLMALKGILAIQAGDNPRLVERKLWSFLPYDQRQVGGRARAA